MAKRTFDQNELNRIVAARLGRERERLTKEFEIRLKRCMASVHLTIYQEMCSLRRAIDAETNDPLRSSSVEEQHSEQPTDRPTTRAGHNGGEKA